MPIVSDERRPTHGAGRRPTRRSDGDLSRGPDRRPTRGVDVRREGEQRWGELGDFIRQQRRITRLSLRKLSEMAGISNPYLSQIERGLRRPSAEILQQIARALQISCETLYVRAGILDERTDEADLSSEVRRDPYISEEQKTALLRIYWSFRRDNGHGVHEVSPNGSGKPSASPQQS